jgi:predicted enzyme related to lactoylglutathione lyase
MSAGHLSRQFKIADGESPYSYLMTRRIERAMALLRRGDLGVTKVCFAVGCSSLGTFSTRFNELVGVSPSTYRDQTAHMEAGLPSCVEKQVTTYAIIVLATKDLDGVFERLQATDADIVQEPTEQPYGIRDCAVRDPAGTMIRIQELS